MYRLEISKKKKSFMCNGSQFFWLGDTAWETLHQMSREEMCFYLDTRQKQGFNVVQSVALGESDGINTPNYYGRFPLKNSLLPEIVPDDDGESYWKHVDFFVREAEKREIYVALLPTWGDKYNLAWGSGPEIFNGKNAYEFGKWIGNRYKDCPNIVWVLGGDRMLEKKLHFDVIYAMAEGIRDSGACQLISFHPTTTQPSSKYLHSEEWLDFNMQQTGHNSRMEISADELIKKDLALEPTKPVIDAEPCYEDIPIDFDPSKGYFDASSVRNRVYRTVFAGACGATYGHNSVWSMTKKQDTEKGFYICSWKDALTRPGAGQMQYLKRLMDDFCIDDAREVFLAYNYSGENYFSAVTDGTKTYIYTPNGLGIPAEGLSYTSAEWYDPKNGNISKAEQRDGLFMPEVSGRGEDKVLILK